MSKIHFFYEEVSFRLEHKKIIRHWIESIILSHNKVLQSINYIFCSDDYLFELNRKYLYHDTLTDILTFDNSNDPNVIEGDIFISTDRVSENSIDLGYLFEKELHRVMIHGILHLMGYSDKTKDQKSVMRENEDASLSLLPF
ncbi:MAG: rRNA maturation RNase YbeY [Bacteroidetes bacterium]|nr:rRNA maturation RNase YbeY [Bacteroidota bacterium]MDA1119008.1 rRNA maturation RNase YbeY [Bacteroidota bacterium]